MPLPDFTFEKKFFKKGFHLIAGADEVGRGAWAGPVVTAAVVLAPAKKLDFFEELIHQNQIMINDSKKMKFRQRRQTALWLKQNSLGWGIGESQVSLINRLGLAKAIHIAFRQSLARLNLYLRSSLSSASQVDFLLADAFSIPRLKTLSRCHQHPLIKGDTLSLSIAAASIIAKDYRDSLMIRLAKAQTVYSWGKNKGYGTHSHQQAILQFSQTRHHRTRFVSTWLSRL